MMTPHRFFSWHMQRRMVASVLLAAVGVVAMACTRSGTKADRASAQRLTLSVDSERCGQEGAEDHCAQSDASVYKLAAKSSAPQPASYIATLVLPPPSAGTCVPVTTTTGRDRAKAPMRGHSLVMTTVEPDGRREMIAFTDSAGRVRSYVEMVMRMSGPTSSVGETVIAMVTPDNRVTGTLRRQTMAMTLPASGRIDTTAMRVMGERARITRARTGLSAPQQAQVRALAAWLVQRCPT